jgi:hypothetical protein
MVAVPTYGIDGLASDVLTSSAEETLATHSMIRARKFAFMVVPIVEKQDARDTVVVSA